MSDSQKTNWYVCVGLFESAQIVCPTFAISDMHDERDWLIIKYVIAKDVQKEIDDMILTSLKGVE